MGKSICGLSVKDQCRWTLSVLDNLTSNFLMANLKYVKNFILGAVIRSQADGCDLAKAFLFWHAGKFPNCTVSCVTSVCLSLHRSLFMDRLGYLQTNICGVY